MTERLIDFERSITERQFLAIKRSQFNLNRQLKFLCIRLAQPFCFGALNGFEQLEHLELSFRAGIKNPTAPLKLLELRLLMLDFAGSCGPIETPKLSVLSCRFIRNLQVEYPETIKWLRSDCHGADLMGKFVNLEVFKCRAIVNLEPNLLSVWKNLKELDIEDSLFQISFLSLEGVKRSLASILKQRNTLKRSELKCYLDDVQLINESQLDDFPYSLDDLSNFKLKYHQLLRGHSHYEVSEINYNALLDSAHELPSDFFC